ncbi:MAG: MBL fold metallo-hydrolase [Clostridia bacterium]|nr:MBL fold metallo-hydrolase [Clostridia bacterium]
MSLNIVSLASGSKGNCTLIYSENTAILCDAGISYTRILDGLAKYRTPLSAVQGSFITHEPSDHIAALPKISRFVPIYAHHLTAQAIFERQGALSNYRSVDFYENGFSIGDIKVEPFRVPHDAAYPLGDSFECDKKRASIAIK